MGGGPSYRRALRNERIVRQRYVPKGRSRAQELCNDRNLRRVHKRWRVADFRKLDQFRARPALGHFLGNWRR